MNDRQKLNYIKKHLTGLKYLNSLLKDAISYHEEVGDGDYQFVYLNKYCLICDIIIISKINHYANKRNVLQ